MSPEFKSTTLKIFLNRLPCMKVSIHNGDKIIIYVPEERLLQSLLMLKNHTNFQFKLLTCVSGTDYPNLKNRFMVAYELLSLKYNTRVCLKTFSDEINPIASSAKLFKAAAWYESEIWDMFGVFFSDHPNLTRLLTDYGFEGFPLRKDFPLSGFVESAYDYTRKQVLNSRLEMSQEFKFFDSESPWSN